MIDASLQHHTNDINNPHLFKFYIIAMFKKIEHLDDVSKRPYHHLAKVISS